ncbi:pol polyprotein [Tanacetum coccineum]
MSVEDLVVRLRIEEDNKLAQKNTYTPDSSKVNMVDHAGHLQSLILRQKEKAKRRITRRAKGRLSHHVANCKMPKRVNPRQANMVNDNVDMIAMVSDVIVMIFEVNLVGSNNSGWWVDTRATRHVYADKSMFHSFRAVDNGEKLYIGNFTTADIKGEGDVILKMTSEKELNLTNISLFCPQMYVGKGICVMIIETHSLPISVTSSEGHQWKEAIKSEIDSILQNHMWELVDLPPGCKPLGYKWIFKKKMKADGTIDKYKARLVIKGYRQRKGLDYFDTYSPVLLRITSKDKMIKSTKDMLKSKFDMKDMSLADVILGIKES